MGLGVALHPMHLEDQLCLLPRVLEVAPSSILRACQSRQLRSSSSGVPGPLQCATAGSISLILEAHVIKLVALR